MLKPLIVGHKFNLPIDLFNSEKIKYWLSTICEKVATCEIGPNEIATFLTLNQTPCKMCAPRKLYINSNLVLSRN